MPHREQLPEEEVKVFSRDQLAAVLTMAPERHRPLFKLLAATGPRISEAIALQRLHLQLDQDKPEVCVRRAIVRDRIVPPKSKYGHREVRLPPPLALKLRAHLATQPDQDSIALVFPSEAGGSFNPGNLRRRVLKPLAGEVDAPLGRLPHVPPHLRLAPSQPRHQPPPAKPRPRPPLTRLHADPLHAPAARRRGADTRSRSAGDGRRSGTAETALSAQSLTARIAYADHECRSLRLGETAPTISPAYTPARDI